MSLSICIITADPPARVAAAIEPLRPCADEVLIAADSRVDEQTLAGYAALADRLFRIEFNQSERHLAWLCAQCRGDWILRVDGDEVPSRAFVARLPEMLGSREVRQFWVTYAWVYPDAEHVLAGAPWAEDFVSRLIRNDASLRVRGLLHLHADPVTPREYVDEPFYHLNLLTASKERRLDKAVCYEVMRPRLLAAGGGRINEAFYLPELRDSLELRPVPQEDRPAIARALDGRPAAPPAGGARAAVNDSVPFVSLKEMDRHWEARTVGADAYHASIAPREPASSLAPSEQRSLYFSVRNEGTERWPASLDAQPPIRLSYRWLNADGSMHTQEGPRSPFPRVVAPGERILAPLHVDAPLAAGDYLLEVDLVHEYVRWFDTPCRVPVRVQQPADLPAAGARLCETTPPKRQRWRRVRIPRAIHRVWVGTGPMPEEHAHFAATLVEHHPGFEMRLWTDEDLPGLGIGEGERASARTHAELSNLVRYEVLARFGGVYVDTDVECRRAFTPLLRGIDAFAALESPGQIGNAVLGSIPCHPAFGRAARLARRTLGMGVHSADANGPYLLRLIAEQEQNIAILGAHLFYPFLWNELERRGESFPDAYAIHHWAHTWEEERASGPGG